MASTVMEPGRGRGLVKNLVGLYTSPGPEFTAIVPCATILRPLLLLVLLNIAFTSVWFSRVDTAGFFRAQNEHSRGWREMPAEQKAGMVAMQTRFLKPIGWTAAIVGAPLFVVIVATFYLFVFRFFLASEVTFRQSVSIVAWALAAVALLTTPLTLLTMVLKGDWTLDPAQVLQASLGAALDPDTAPKALYAVARSLDLFVFWILYLMWLGYRVATLLRPSTVAWALLVPWALLVAVKAGFAALF
jgi:hypothetical protein